MTYPIQDMRAFQDYLQNTPGLAPSQPTLPAATATTQTTPFGFSTQAQGDAVVAAVRAIITALHNNGITL